MACITNMSRIEIKFSNNKCSFTLLKEDRESGKEEKRADENQITNIKKINLSKSYYGSD